MVAELINPDGGEITLSGEPLFDSGLRINLPPEERKIGYVFQNYALFPHLTVRENVAFGLRARRLPRQKIEERVTEQMEAAGLWELRDARAVRISGGQKQRTAPRHRAPPPPAGRAARGPLHKEAGGDEK
jgi:molybdate transport system ATP-binding protein